MKDNDLAAGLTPSRPSDSHVTALRHWALAMCAQLLAGERTIHDLKQEFPAHVSAAGAPSAADPHDLEAARARIAELEAEQESLRNDISRLTGDVAELDAHLDFARYENDALRSSRSMRVGQRLGALTRPVVVVQRRISRREPPAFREPPPSTAAGGWHGTNHQALASAGPMAGSADAAVDELWQSVSEALRAQRTRGGCAAPLVLRRKASLEPALSRSPAVREALLEAECAALVSGGLGGVDTYSQQNRSAVVVDVRCLLDPRHQARGIGRHASAALDALSAFVGVHDLVALIGDVNASSLPDELASRFGHVIRRAVDIDPELVAAFVQTSPMTAPCDIVMPFLSNSAIKTAALIYDFIPLQRPDDYLGDGSERARYEARLLALKAYDLGLAISEATAARARSELGWSANRVIVTGVADSLGMPSKVSSNSRHILAPSGGDPRKNLLAAIRAFARYRSLSGDRHCRLLISGQFDAGFRTSVTRVAQGLALAPSDIEFLPHLSDQELSSIYASSLAVVVPSYLEGFSIPVAEAINRSVPVVASNIPEHRELTGDGWWLVDPEDIAAMSQALVRAVGESEEVVAAQRLAHGDLSSRSAVRDRLVTGLRPLCSVPQVEPPTRRPRSPRDSADRRRIALLTPWPPQASGISDFSEFVAREMATFAEVTVFTQAIEPASGAKVELRPLSAEPYLSNAYDLVIAVIGNSAFHIPILEYVERFGGVVVAHDNRMVELYTWWRGPEETAKLLDRPGHPVSAGDIPGFIEDLDSLTDLGFKEICRDAQQVVVHSRDLASRVSREGAREVKAISFIPYRVPSVAIDLGAHRRARETLSMTDKVIQLGTFGEVDLRTKGVDNLVSALAWLKKWSTPVHLHVLGSADQAVARSVLAQAEHLDVHDCLTLHGRVTPQEWDTWLLALDAAVQLRTSSVLTISGALMDCIAFGLPTLASRQLALEVSAPSYVEQLPDAAGPLLVAEAIRGLKRRTFDEGRSNDREAYLSRFNASTYVRELLEASGLRV